MNVFLFILTFVLVVFIGTLIHELGHALGAKIASFQEIKISIGSGIAKRSFRIFGIEWIIHSIFLFGGHMSYKTTQAYKPLDVAFVAMMGPLFNGLTVFLLVMFTNIYLHYSLYLFFLFNAWLLIANIFPLQWKNKQSDGYIILQKIREHMHVPFKK